jgi:ABC-2 type transport system permease protein
MPVIQILLFGFAITNEINNVQIAILDHSKDVTTKDIIQKISASKYFTINQFIKNETDIEPVFKKGKIKAILSFEKDFDEKLFKSNNPKIQIITDATDPNTANTITNYVNAIVQSYIHEVNKDVQVPYQIIPTNQNDI